MEESEADEEIEALRAIWPELEDRPKIWNSPSVAIPVCPLGSLGETSSTRVTVVIIFNPRYPKVPPRLELENPVNLDDEEVSGLKRALDMKATELSGNGVVMGHDLLLLTCSFLSEKDQLLKAKVVEGSGSLFQKMHSSAERERQRREEEERAEERRQRDEEAKAMLEREAAGKAQWAVLQEKLEKEKIIEEKKNATIQGRVLDGVIPEASGGYYAEQHECEPDERQDEGVSPDRVEEDELTETDDDWMNEGEQGGYLGVDGPSGEGNVAERSSWYRSQFKELENLGKGGFGTVVKVRNRVDRRLYAVKKVALDPFDKETNRKIRREVTTISTLIHKNIVRYYQAWLEGGGGGAYPAAVEEEEQSDVHHDGDEEGAGDTDSEVEQEPGIGFFRTLSSSSSRKIARDAVKLSTDGAELDRKSCPNSRPSAASCGARSPTSLTRAGIGSNAAASGAAAVDGDARAGGRDDEEVVEKDSQQVLDGHKPELGKKAQRRLRRILRKQQRPLRKQHKGKGARAVVGAGGKGTAPDATAGEDKGGASLVRRQSKSSSSRCKDSSVRSGFPTGSLWARGGGRAGFASSSSSSDSESASSKDGNIEGAWSSARESSELGGKRSRAGAGGKEGGAAGVGDADGEDLGSDESWGSGGGNYHSHGQGKLVSDTEFFEYFDSPERTRKVENAGSHLLLPTSWSSEDALTQLSEEMRRSGRNGAGGDKVPATGTQQSYHDHQQQPGPGSDVDNPAQNKGMVENEPQYPPTPPPSGRPIKVPVERQFLYIQMEYCENTLRHLIDSDELWREEQRCWRLFRQMLEGVDFIHTKGIIHRDLTPPNVFLDGEENVKLGDFGLATSKKARDKATALSHQGAIGVGSDDEFKAKASLVRNGDLRDPLAHTRHSELTSNDVRSMDSGPLRVTFGDVTMSVSDTSQLTEGVGTGPYIAPEQGARSGQYNHKADMWSLGVILFEMLSPKFGTLMERAEVMTALRAGGKDQFPAAFEARVSHNVKKVIRWLLKLDADARPAAAELLSSALLPPKLEVEATFLREALRVMGNPESGSFQAIVKAFLQQEMAEHVEHWYDRESLRTVSSQIPSEASAVSLVCDGLRRVFETHGASPVAPPALRPKPPPSLAPASASSRRSVYLLDEKGAVVTLPDDLTAPFARFVARSGITRLKRYQIDRVFRASGPAPSGLVEEMWEADFDIIASGFPCSSANVFPSGHAQEEARSSFGGGGAGSSSFVMVEAEAVLVMAQVMGTFKSCLGPWVLRLANVKMTAAILELCEVPLPARAVVNATLGRLARGSITPAEAWTEVEEKASLPGDAALNFRPFLYEMGKGPFEVLASLERLVQRIPIVKSVMGVPNSARRRELTRKEAVRMKRSLVAFREGLEGLLALATALGRLGLIRLPAETDEDAASVMSGSHAAGGTGITGGASGAQARARAVQGGGKGSRRKQQRKGDLSAVESSRAASADSRTDDRSDGDLRGVSGRGSGCVGGGGDGRKGKAKRSGSFASALELVGGELDSESWGRGVCPTSVSLVLWLTQGQGNYTSGTIFQAALIDGGPLSGTGQESLRTTVAEGGRYDDLVARHQYHLRSGSSNLSAASSTVCAVGVRFAVGKIASSMLLAPSGESSPGCRSQAQRSGRYVDAVVCSGGGFDVQELQERVLVAARLWAGGIRAEYLPTDALQRAGAGRGGGLDGVLEACSSTGIPYVVVVRPHTLVSKTAVKVLSVLEKGSGQLEVPLDQLAQRLADGLAALANPESTSAPQRAATGSGGEFLHSKHHHHHHHHSSASSLSVSAGGVKARLALVDRGQTGGGSLDREKMTKQEFKAHSTLERKISSMVEAAIAGPDRTASPSADGEGPLVLATEASFPAVRGLTTAYMLYGSDSRQVIDLVDGHSEKKFLRNLVSALQEVEGGTRRVGKGQGRGGQNRQVFVYSLTNELMDLVTLPGPGISGLVLTHQSSGGAGSKGSRASRKASA